MKTILIISLTICLVALSTGCKDASLAQFRSLGTKHRVTLYSGGKVMGTWISTGNVSNEGQSDGYYFEDNDTHKLIEVSGTVLIEQM
jgi:hypothetical protein